MLIWIFVGPPCEAPSPYTRQKAEYSLLSSKKELKCLVAVWISIYFDYIPAPQGAGHIWGGARGPQEGELQVGKNEVLFPITNSEQHLIQSCLLICGEHMTRSRWTVKPKLYEHAGIPSWSEIGQFATAAHLTFKYNSMHTKDETNNSKCLFQMYRPTWFFEILWQTCSFTGISPGNKLSSVLMYLCNRFDWRRERLVVAVNLNSELDSPYACLVHWLQRNSSLLFHWQYLYISTVRQ